MQPPCFLQPSPLRSECYREENETELWHLESASSRNHADSYELEEGLE
jgi:hypothetical protein